MNTIHMNSDFVDLNKYVFYCLLNISSIDYISIPRDWKYGKDDDVTVVVSDVCVVIPQTIAGATGELKVLRTLEAMMDANIINTGDIQKAIEHILV